MLPCGKQNMWSLDIEKADVIDVLMNHGIEKYSFLSQILNNLCLKRLKKVPWLLLAFQQAGKSKQNKNTSSFFCILIFVLYFFHILIFILLFHYQIPITFVLLIDCCNLIGWFLERQCEIYFQISKIKVPALKLNSQLFFCALVGPFPQRRVF